MKAKPQKVHSYEWCSKAREEDKEEEKLNKAHKQAVLAKKLSIESKHLLDVSFKDLYNFPFHQAKYGSWVYDADSNFIFQFEIKDEDTREKCLKILNGDFTPTKSNEFVHDSGMIYLIKDGERFPFILIRGWGNLTGIGGYNLDGNYADKIQDTLAEFIVEKLKL